MKEAVSRTIALLRRHPILWLPQLCAVCLGWVIESLYNLAAGAIWHWLWHPARTYSADPLDSLLSVPEMPSKGILLTRSVLQTPLLLISDTLQIALCAVAFVVVAIFVGRLRQGGSTDPRTALPLVRRNSENILYITLITIGLFILKLLLSGPVLAWISSRPGFTYMPFWRLEALDWASKSCLMLAVIYIIVPRALDAARPTESFPPSSQTLRTARLLAVIVTIVWILIQFGLRGASHAVFQSYNDHRELWLFLLQFAPTLTMVAALTFLSVSLAILATNESDSSIIPSDN